MSRRYSFPEGHWDWPVKLTHYHAVRAGNLIFTGGQVDLDSKGTVRNLGDLDAQCRNSMTYMSDLFTDLDVAFSDLVRLVVYYVGDVEDEKKLLHLLAEIIGEDVRPVVHMISMPELCYPGMLTEIEGVAMRNPNGDVIERQCFHLDTLPQLPKTFSHVVRADDIVFVGDLASRTPEGTVLTPNDSHAQSETLLNQLKQALEIVGANLDDIVKLNSFHLQESKSLDLAAAYRNAITGVELGPAVTDIPLPSFPQQNLTAKLSATAICQPRDLSSASNDSTWEWPQSKPQLFGVKAGNIIHLSGQVSLDSELTDMVSQTREVMRNIATKLSEFGATLDHVVKATTFYQGRASAESLHENLLIRSGSYTRPGPATTGIPVVDLAYEGSAIEVEVIAILD